MTTPLTHLLPSLPGFTALPRTSAAWPVWSGSTTAPIRFAPMAKKAAVRLRAAAGCLRLESLPAPVRRPAATKAAVKKETK